jgi:hypothetical protein
LEAGEDEMATTKQILMALAAMVLGLAAQAAWAGDLQTTLPGAAKTTATDEVKREIVVSLEDRKLALVENGQAVKVYPVAVGKPSTPSPVGTFAIERRVANPTYHHDGKTILPGPNNPVGTRWMGLSIRGYGIHGTNEPRSIGKAASHGCIRMAKADLEELYPLVEVGDSVEIVGQRNEETARLFGNGVTPAGAAQIELATRSAAPAATASRATTAQATAATTESENNQVEAGALAISAGAL